MTCEPPASARRNRTCVEHIVLDILAAGPAMLLKVVGDPEAAEEALGGGKALGLELTAVELRHMEVAAAPGVGITAIVVKPSPAVLDSRAS